MSVNTLRFVQPTQADADNEWSDSIWGTCPLESIRDGQTPGTVLEYEFDGFKLGTVNAAEAFWADHFNAFGSATGAIADAAIVGGGVTLGATAVDEGGSINQSQVTWQISRSTYSFWFEVQLAPSTIADTKHNIFAGLIDATAATAISPLTAAGALADVNLVGFHRPESARTVAGTGGAIMNTVYKANTIPAVTVQNDAVALTAGTYTKLGMWYQPQVNPFNSGVGDGYGKYLLSFFQDGRMCATQKQIPAADGTDFPNDIRMRFCLAVLNATATAPGNTAISRVRIAQVTVPSV